MSEERIRELTYELESAIERGEVPNQMGITYECLSVVRWFAKQLTPKLEQPRKKPFKFGLDKLEIGQTVDVMGKVPEEISGNIGYAKKVLKKKFTMRRIYNEKDEAIGTRIGRTE